MARVFLNNISKVFNQTITAVNGFTLEIKDGEFMVIVGPSGCGKTTTLRLIAGLEKQTTGDIYIGDDLINQVNPQNRDVAMVFQNYVLYPHMTAYQNMAFALKMKKYSKEQINRYVEETAKILDIQNLLSRKPRELSGGQRQRVALGKAIVRKPSVFLFDEPLSNLDAEMRLAMRDELKILHRKLKTTTIYVTHDQAEAMTLGERICVMYKGIIQQVAKPIEVYEKPVNRFVAGFLGTPSMNFFTGYLESKDNSLCFRIGDETLVLPRPLRSKLNNHLNHEMVLGIRPENISINQYSDQRDNSILAKIDFFETPGNRTDISLKNKTGEKFVLSTKSFNNLKVNLSLQVYLDLQKIHIFEPGMAGKNIL